jgi:hypothetical protein
MAAALGLGVGLLGVIYHIFVASAIFTGRARWLDRHGSAQEQGKNKNKPKPEKEDKD